MVFASSLLGIVREGHLLPNDVEIDVCVHGDDLNEELMEDFKTEGLYKGTYPCKEKYGEIYLTPESTMKTEKGWLAISSLWLKKGVCYINIESNECIVWPDSKYYDKKTWSTVEYLGRKLPVPSDPEAWLEMWYGKDWKTPLACHWKDNKNRKRWEALWD